VADGTCRFCAHALDGRSKKFCTTCLPPYGEWDDKSDYKRRYMILRCAIGEGTANMHRCRIKKGHPAFVKRPFYGPPRPNGRSWPTCQRCDVRPVPTKGSKYCNNCRPVVQSEKNSAAAKALQERIRSERPPDWKPVDNWRKRQRVRERDAAKRRSGTKPTVQKLAERDGWTCHLCRLAIKPELTGTSSKYKASVDHLVPLSDGGDDEMWNCKLAHLRCNAKRGARGVAQLLLAV
jgi:hypothetical protein